MKIFLTVLLVLAMVFALSPVAFARSHGHFGGHGGGYHGHGGYYGPRVVPYPYFGPYFYSYPYPYYDRCWYPGYWAINPVTGVQYYVPGYYAPCR